MEEKENPIDEFIKELEKICIENGWGKPVYGNKTGSFTAIIPNTKPKE